MDENNDLSNFIQPIYLFLQPTDAIYQFDEINIMLLLFLISLILYNRSLNFFFIEILLLHFCAKQ
jgi:hypothetical protein